MEDYTKNKLFLEYLKALFNQAGIRAFFAIAVLIALGLTEGIGLLMLIPFLQLIGIGDSTPTGIVAIIGQVWNYTGLPLTLPAVLAVYVAIVSVFALIQRGPPYSIRSCLMHSLANCVMICSEQWLEFSGSVLCRSEDRTSTMS